MNPLMKDVFRAFEAVHDHPRSIIIDRKGVVLPAGDGTGHFQGIQRMPSVLNVPGVAPENLLAITSSSAQQGFFVTCSMAPDWLSGRANPPTMMPPKTGAAGFSHAGGCQSFGNYLAAGLENASETTSEIQFWNLKGAPKQALPALSRCTNGHLCTAGAVGMTSFGKGTVLAVASYNSDTIDFYTSEGDPFTGSPFVFLLTFEASKANKNGWLDNNWAQYQNINLITQTDQSLWMVAFDRSGFSDWMDLYSLDLRLGANSIFRKASKKHMYCTDGVELGVAGGIFIASQSAFDVYGVKPLSGDHNSGTIINVNYFSAT